MQFFSKTKSAEEDRFYRLDNSAVFMAAIAGSSGPFVFSMYCELEQAVVLPALETALNALFPRFPFLFVSLRRGVFWHYLDPVDHPPRIEAEPPFPCSPMPRRLGHPMIRVTAKGGRITSEFHHVLTDGTGAIAFMKALVVEYLRNIGVGTELGESALGDIKRPGQPVDPEEEEDAYQRYFKSHASLPDRSRKSFLIPGLRLDSGAYRQTVGVVEVSQILGLAKAKGVSVTEYLASVHLFTLQRLYESLDPAKRRKARPYISIQIPVNLRSIYPSKTLRNFFLFAAPSIDLRLGHWSFDEILYRVHHQLRLGMGEKELLRQLKRNVGGERNPLGRPVLLPIKTLVLRIINQLIGVSAYSGSISNLGILELPPPFAAPVRRFGFLPARSKTTGANVGIMTWKGGLYIFIGSMVARPEFERVFFQTLVFQGCRVKVESNQELIQ